MRVAAFHGARQTFHRAGIEFPGSLQQTLYPEERVYGYLTSTSFVPVETPPEESLTR